jgi:hypothetical protein
MRQRFGWALVGALALASLLALARATTAGPLDPPGPVGSTMRTIDELLPSWGKTLTASGGCASKRFTCVLPTAGVPSGEGVLDHETGLVWQRGPSAITFSYSDADYWCRTTKIGGRYGWRLPLASEIMTLIDDTQNDSLPAGHPFTITTDVYYWTQTPDATNSQFLQTVTFLQGGNAVSVEPRPREGGSGANPRAFCVRGNGDSGEPQAADEVPAWSRKLDAAGACHSARFQCVLPTNADFEGEGVLDRETGLVWQRTPSSTISNFNAVFNNCSGATTGGRRGWRLPTYSEAQSLFDPAQGGDVALPSGHPFNIAPALQSANFASISTFLSDGSYMAYALDGATLGNFTKIGATQVAGWCVRGAGGEYAY